jgi:hypothetical protein
MPLLRHKLLFGALRIGSSAKIVHRRVACATMLTGGSPAPLRSQAGRLRYYVTRMELKIRAGQRHNEEKNVYP